MNKGIALVWLLALVLPAYTKAASEFHEPWKNKRTAIIIDAYHKNSINWNQLKQDHRVAGIIHKASEGFKADPQYRVRKKEALRRGYRWGSYHLGRPGDPIKQADYYLKITKPKKNELVALDLEGLNSRFMSLAAAKKFILRIKQKLGRYPVVYGNHRVIKTISKSLGKDPVFSKTPLWYARFRKNIPDFSKETWDSYTLWQFSSEINCKKHQRHCLYRVPGTEHDMDINVFNGTVKELKRKWPFASK